MTYYKFIILIIIILVSYIFYIYFKKLKLIDQIISEWRKQTNGFVKKDEHHYYGDYYLSVNPLGNYDSHIHLITNNHSFIHFYNVFYMLKKDDIHSHIFIINKNKNVPEIVTEMINNYNKFEI